MEAQPLGSFRNCHQELDAPGVAKPEAHLLKILSLETMIRLRDVLAFVLLTVWLFRSVGAKGQAGSGSSKNPATPQGRNTSPVAIPLDLKPCDPAGMPPLQLSQPGTGHHKIALSWDASVPTPNHPSKPVGYCLYRSQKQGAAKLKPTCKECEQVNRVPFAGTSCLDNIVEDGAQYYYVAIAVSASGTSSPASNEAPVRVPPANETKTVTQNPTSLPLCRGASPSK